LSAYRWIRHEYASKREDEKRRKLFFQLRKNVDRFVEEFRSIPDNLICDESFIEKFIIEKAGLNNEHLHEQPPELAPHYGTGLYLWQNPKQFSKYIVWLLKNTKNCESYLEIGCRWGGTFIVICEVLRRANPHFRLAIAADLIEPTPFIERYREIANKEGLQIKYFQGSSTSEDFSKLINKEKPDVSFIDGDHSFLGALKDHLLVRNFSQVIIHHDIYSDSCPETTSLWSTLKTLEVCRKDAEFIEQYDSVNGKFLGIGILYSIKDTTTME
jgi:hypothetical protein